MSHFFHPRANLTALGSICSPAHAATYGDTLCARRHTPGVKLKEPRESLAAKEMGFEQTHCSRAVKVNAADVSCERKLASL